MSWNATNGPGPATRFGLRPGGRRDALKHGQRRLERCEPEGGQRPRGEAVPGRMLAVL